MSFVEPGEDSYDLIRRFVRHTWIHHQLPRISTALCELHIRSAIVTT